MKNTQPLGKISLEEYKALLNSIGDVSLRFINDAIEAMMPAEQHTVGTLYGVVLHIATKAICTICDEDEEAKKRAADFFCERLPKLVKEALVIPASAMNKNKH